MNEPALLSPQDVGPVVAGAARAAAACGLTFEESCRAYEREHLRAVLEKCRGNQTKAAALLDMHRNTLSHKIDDLFDGYVPGREKGVRPLRRKEVQPVLNFDYRERVYIRGPYRKAVRG
jgi:hypothetical protein